MAIFSMILSLLCGVSLFLFGMSLMGDGLKLAAGNKLEAFLYKMTNTPLKGVALGTGVTSVIQSSSATTVMVIGFVNSGMMKLKQAIGIIMGANIGTSITGWILCLSYIEGSSGIAKVLSTATISAVVAVIGTILRMVCKRTVHKNIGNIMLGFAILMTGMQMMSGAVSPLRENPVFVDMLTMFSNPIAGILVGVLFTAVLQSASATVGVLQALSVTGILTFASAFPIVLGIGVGAGVGGAVASAGLLGKKNTIMQSAKLLTSVREIFLNDEHDVEFSNSVYEQYLKNIAEIEKGLVELRLKQDVATGKEKRAIAENIKKAEKSVEAMKVARKSMLKYNSSFAEGLKNQRDR